MVCPEPQDADVLCGIWSECRAHRRDRKCFPCHFLPRRSPRVPDDHDQNGGREPGADRYPEGSRIPQFRNRLQICLLCPVCHPDRQRDRFPGRAEDSSLFHYQCIQDPLRQPAGHPDAEPCRTFHQRHRSGHRLHHGSNDCRLLRGDQSRAGGTDASESAEGRKENPAGEDRHHLEPSELFKESDLPEPVPV